MIEKKVVAALIVVLLASLALAPTVTETSVISENATYRANKRAPADYSNFFSLAKPIRISVGSEGVKITELDYIASELDANEVELITEYRVEEKEDGTVAIYSTISIRDSSGVIETGTSQMPVSESLYTETVEYTASDEDIANDLAFTELIASFSNEITTETEISEINLTIVSDEFAENEPTAWRWRSYRRTVSRVGKAIGNAAGKAAPYVGKAASAASHIYSGYKTYQATYNYMTGKGSGWNVVKEFSSSVVSSTVTGAITGGISGGPVGAAVGAAAGYLISLHVNAYAFCIGAIHGKRASER